MSPTDKPDKILPRLQGRFRQDPEKYLDESEEGGGHEHHGHH